MDKLILSNCFEHNVHIQNGIEYGNSRGSITMNWELTLWLYDLGLESGKDYIYSLNDSQENFSKYSLIISFKDQNLAMLCKLTWL